MGTDDLVEIGRLGCVFFYRGWTRIFLEGISGALMSFFRRAV